MRVVEQLKSAAKVMHDKVDTLQAKTMKGQANTQRAIECFHPDLLGTPSMLSYGDMSKHIPQIPRTEWERYVVIPTPKPPPDTKSARVAWWNEKRTQFPTLASIAVFFIRRPRSLMWNVFSV